VVVEEHPAQDLPPLGGVVGPKLSKRFCEVVEDDARLRQHQSVVEEIGTSPIRLQRAILRRARLAAEIVDEARLPVGTRQRQRQRRLVRVAGLREAVKYVIGHA
jgi:hypothetical protein